MAIEYVGDCEFDETEDSGMLTEDFWGMDELTRIFEGRNDLLVPFILKFKKKYFDDEFPQLGLTNRVIVPGRAFTKVTLTYKGLLDNDLPDPVVEGGWTQDSARVGLMFGQGKFSTHGWMDLGLGNFGSRTTGNQKSLPIAGLLSTAVVRKSLEQIGDEETAEVEITYNAPRTTFHYVTRKEPKVPRYGQTLLLSEGDFEIVETRPATFRGRPVINREIRTVDFQKRRAGNFWEVSEVTQGKLVPARVAMRGMAGRFKISGKKPKTLNFT